MTLFYLLMLTIVALVIYSGYDETLNLVKYLDLQFKYTILRVRMKFMERTLRKKLLIDRAKFKESFQEYIKNAD
ncbi:MAG: hypothetical protein CMQ56_00365 [Gammaproteobacteria bacterium]|nr:hypothetical protein [Gammaproteobacteria bacterium]